MDFQSITTTLSTIEPAPYLAVVIALGVLAQWFAWYIKVPSLLLLLLLGFGLGQVVSPDRVLGSDLLFGGVNLAVGIILFEGSLSLRVRDLKELARPVVRLCTITVAAAWALTTLITWLVGFDLEVALLVGAILVVTGPTVLAPILRTLRPTRRVAALLRWEGIVVDPIGAVLAVLVFQVVRVGGPERALSPLLLTLGKTLGVAFALALVLGALLELLMRRHAIPDFLQGVVFLAAAVGAMAASNALQSESGLLTVTVLGIYLGNRPGLHLGHVAEFKEHLQVLLVGSLFIILPGRLSPQALLDVLPQALVVIAALVLVVRPLSVVLGLWRTKVTRQEKALLAFMAPRGIVAAAVTSIFGLHFAHLAEQLDTRAAQADGQQAAELQEQASHVAALAEQADRMVPLVFLVIVATVTIYGLGVGRLAERLGLARPSPQGVLFVGGPQWVVAAARVLTESGVDARVVARDRPAVVGARQAGIDTVAANILSSYAVNDMDLAGIGSLVACTDDDEVNATAAREFGPVLGRANVYQLQREGSTDGPPGRRRDPAPHLTARPAFQPPLSHAQLVHRFSAGVVAQHIDLTPQFTLEDFRRRYQDAVVLFMLRKGRVTVVTEQTKLRRSGASLVALVPGNNQA